MTYRSERGGSLAWFAVVMATITAFLAALTIDIPRLGYVRVHLQAANDAACQAAADTLNVPLFRNTGRYEIDDRLMYSQASPVFYATLADSSRIGFGASLSLRLLDTRTVECVATAGVTPLIPVSPTLNTRAYTVSQMRARALLP